MKQINLSLLTVLITAQAAGGQNLVPNPSFENYSTCPLDLSTLRTASWPSSTVHNWSRATQATADYHHICGQPRVGVPGNFMGHQYPKTGNGYTGIYLASSGDNPNADYYEYIQSKLIIPMVNRHRYYISYWVCPAELYNLKGTITAIDQYSVLFTPDSIERTGTSILSYTPQLTSPAGMIYGDTSNWTRISHTYTATGQERWVLFGCFKAWNQLAKRTLRPGTGPTVGYSAYSYYDDICIMDLDGPPTASSLRDTTICPQAAIILSGRDSATSYRWNDGDPNKDKTITEPGTYWVKSMSIESCSFTTDSFTVQVSINQLRMELGNDTTICSNKPLKISAYHDSLTHYHWNTGDTTADITVRTPGIYYMEGAAICYEATSDTIEISLIPGIEFSLPGDTLLCKGTLLTLTTDSIPYASRQWSTGAQTCCIDVTEAGTYTLTMTNVCDITIQQSVDISYTGCRDCFFIPNAFSPNGDGRNDLFRIYNDCLIGKFLLIIYNRWGQQVFKTENPAAEWDGSFNGRPAELGTYYLYLEADTEFTRMEKIRIKTDITLVR